MFFFNIDIKKNIIIPYYLISGAEEVRKHSEIFQFLSHMNIMNNEIQINILSSPNNISQDE